MFDDSSNLESLNQDAHASSKDENKGFSSISRWSVLVAMAVFCLLYFPFQNYPWSWLVAIAGSYTVIAFGFAVGSVVKDADDFFGDPRVPKSLTTLLLPHAVILIPIMSGAYLWLHFQSKLPHWLTVEGRKGSLWDYCGILLGVIAAGREAEWMASKIKRQCEECEDRRNSE